MEKKSVWVVTRVVIGRVTLSVNTYALRWFDDFSEAVSFLEDEYESFCKNGCEPSKFEHCEWGWTYKSDYIISQLVISLATGG